MTSPDRASSPVQDSERKITVLPFDGANQEWDRSLKLLDDSTFAHLGGWREIMEEVMGHETLYRVAVDATGEINGLLPLVRVRSRLFGDYLLSMPFLSYGGPIGTDEARKALVQNATKEAERLGVDLLELRSHKPVQGPLEVSDRKITVTLDLPEDPRDLWENGLKAKVRSQIRRPKKEGVEARFGPECLDPFYGVFCRTMRDLGTPVLSRRFFQSIATTFPEQAVFCSLHWRGESVAAGCGFHWREEFELTWAGALREYNPMAPNMLLYWSVIEDAISRGVRVFNFGRCSPGSGTHRFKKQWGGMDVPLPWAQWTPRGVMTTPNPEQKRFGLAIATWKRLPLPMANRLGPWISRCLP
jgi:FemAB-related protein (PEP-CTERM system-associated)